MDFGREHGHTLSIDEEGMFIKGDNVLEKFSLVSIVDDGGWAATAGNDVDSMAATSRKGREEEVRQLHHYMMRLIVDEVPVMIVLCGNVCYI